ncbi:hypothetical protein DVH05_012626 [Phytophthora capsici]|nr:hypothetical protein DVH05_012626 [Phytophthora capsici]
MARVGTHSSRPHSKRFQEGAKMTKPRGARNYSAEERQRLLDIIAARLPVHQDEWNAVARAYNTTSNLTWRARDATSLKRKFAALYTSARGAKISDAGGGSELALAAQLRKKIVRRAHEEEFTPTQQQTTLPLSNGHHHDSIAVGGQGNHPDAPENDQFRSSEDYEHPPPELLLDIATPTTDPLLAWLQKRELKHEVWRQVAQRDVARTEALKRERRAEDLRDTDHRHRELLDNLLSLKYTLKRLKASSS